MIPLHCPGPPDWRVDWDALDAEFEWVRALRECPQDETHHAEGNVWIHTRMVLESLASLPAFRALDERDRSIAFWAALLHDVAKPRCTRTDPDGRITARGHSIQGAIMARRILWREGVAFEAREAICAIIRHHQVPFFLIERDDAEHLARSISQTARCDLLALVTEADARGRICEDAQRLYDNIDLFREFCAERDCLHGAASFPSDHARLLYLRGEQRDPTYRPHESFRAEVTLMSGLPGAGKDSWLRANFPNGPVVSLDRLREEHDVDPTEPQGEIVSRARELAREHLRAGRSFAWNATSLSRQMRAMSLQLFLDYGARVRIAYVEVPEALLFSQNRAREAMVPEPVITRMLDRWELPDLNEAHEVTYAVRPR